MRTKDESPLACSYLNQSLMELGALVCTPRSPDCPACPVRQLCVAFCKGRQQLLPRAGKRAKTTPRRFVAFIVERHGRFLIRQRPEGVVNARLWEFPNIEVKPAGRNGVPRVAKALGFKALNAHRFCVIKHSITRYRIKLEAYLAKPGNSAGDLNGSWRTCEQLENLAFTSAHRRVLQKIANSRTSI